MRNLNLLLLGLSALTMTIPAAAGIVTIDFQGTVGAIGPGGFVVTAKSYSGLASAWDSAAYNAGAVQTILPAGTPVTGRVRIQTDLLPPAVNSTQSALDPFVPTPTHSQTGTIQWIDATIHVGSFSFTTRAKPEDTPPQPAVGEFLFVTRPQVYENMLSYGLTPTWGFSQVDVNGFTTQSSLESAYSHYYTGGGLAVSRFAYFDMFLYRFLSTSPFGNSIAGPPFPFEWSDQGNNDNGYGRGLFLDSRIRSFLQGDDQMVEMSDITMNFTDGFQIDSARTVVPEPASIALAAVGVAFFLVRRRSGRCS